MEKYRKRLGIGFIILFAILVLNLCSVYLFSYLFEKVSFEHFDTFLKVRTGWFVFVQLVLGFSAIFIAFVCKGQSYAPSKIGGIAFALVNLFYLVGNLSYIFTDDNLLSPLFEKFDHLGYVLFFTLYIPGLTLLAWGNKLWLPSKIILSVFLLLTAIAEMSYALRDHISYDTLNLINKIATPIEILCLLACVILTIVWVCKKTKEQIKTQSFETIAY